MRTRIKFCGCTSVADAQAAVELGVDAVGVIFAAESPRQVSLQTAREIARAIPAYVSLVGVFVEPTIAEVEAALDAGYTPQFSGNERALYYEHTLAGPYIKVYHVASDASAAPDAAAFAQAAGDYRHATWMFDTLAAGKPGGTGRTFDWGIARELAGDRPIIIGGGLTADTVGSCIRRARPFAVDVRSGIESDGVKDRHKMRAFVRAVKEADAQA